MQDVEIHLLRSQRALLTNLLDIVPLATDEEVRARFVKPSFQGVHDRLRAEEVLLIQNQPKILGYQLGEEEFVLN